MGIIIPTGSMGHKPSLFTGSADLDLVSQKNPGKVYELMEFFKNAVMWVISLQPINI